MNEEEKEAIEQLKSWREYIIKNKEKVNKANDLEFYIRIVLNLITKLQKENEEKDKQIKTLKHTNKTYKGMLNKQNKQIDLMLNFLTEKDLGFYKKEDGGEIIGQYRYFNKNDWKKYFETKVKKGE